MDLKTRLTYHPPTEDAKPRHAAVEGAYELFLRRMKDLPPGPQYVRAAEIFLEFGRAIEDNAPPSADTTAAIRCVCLARNAMNELISVHDKPGAAIVSKTLINIVAAELYKAKWQANTAIALHYSAPKAEDGAE